LSDTRESQSKARTAIRARHEGATAETTQPHRCRGPQVSIEFDVADAVAVGAAAQELQQVGYALLHPGREEPWGQTVARLQSVEGAIIGISYVPSMHQPDAK
jgi:hypothetical protein